MIESDFIKFVDLTQIRQLLESHHQLSGMPYGLFDANENLLIDIGWQDICTHFHRVCPASSLRCRESDAFIKAHLFDRQRDTLEYCCQNGLRDIAMPIVIDGWHLATFFTGQFFYEDEVIDREFFHSQARMFGFDRAEYMKALDRLPVFSREYVRKNVFFLHNVVKMMAETSLKNLRLSRTISRTRLYESINSARLHLIQFAETHSLDKLLEETANEAQKLTQSCIGFYHFVEDDQIFLRLQNWSTRTKEEFCKIEGKEKHYRIEGAGVWCDCIRHRKPVIHNDYASLPHRKDMPEGHAGLIRELVVPVLRDNKIKAVLGVGNKPVDYTNEDVEAASKLADLVWEIAERKSAGESIRRLSEVIEQSPMSVIITDISGAIEFVNKKFLETTGYTEAEVLGQNPSIKKSAETLPEVYPSLWKTISSGEVWKGVLQNRKKSGELFWEHEIIAPLKDSDGIITHYVGITEDITEHKTLEEQFRQAQKMESVGRLAGGVAHDFNNLLTVVIGNTDLALNEADLSPRLIARLQGIRKAADRSAELTRQLLAFARKQTIVPRVIDLNIAVKGLFTMLRRLIGEGIDLSWRPSETLWPVKIDPSQMDQILANLCINARDAVESGTGTIIIETGNITLDRVYCAMHAGFQPGDYVLLTVSDNGCGMDGEVLNKIFEPFFTTKEQGKGTGLGLSTVYGIVKQNNGFINVYSEPGRGTTFTIYLPRHQSGNEPLQEKQRPASLVLGHETILLVEDEPAILVMVDEILSVMGYRVLSADLPDEAIRMAQEYGDAIHLLITDVIMPGKMGPDLADEIKAVHPETEILFMSGYTGDVIDRYGLLGECFNYIQKPFTEQLLSEKIREVLGKG